MKKWPFLISLFFIFAVAVFVCGPTAEQVEKHQSSQPESVFPENISWNELILHQAVVGNVAIVQTGPDTLNLSGEINKDIVLLRENAAYFETIHLGGEGGWRLYFYRQGRTIFWGLEKSQDAQKLNL